MQAETVTSLPTKVCVLGGLERLSGGVALFLDRRLRTKGVLSKPEIIILVLLYMCIIFNKSEQKTPLESLTAMSNIT